MNWIKKKKKKVKILEHFYVELVQGILLYLQANTDPLGESPLWEGGLHHGDGAAGQNAPIWTHVVRLLRDPRHHGKILGKISGDNAANAFLLQLGRTVQLFGMKT